MKQPLITACTLFILALSAVPGRTTAQSRTSPPNIVLIMVDQMRPDHLTAAKAPVLSSLAAKGIRFIHAYTASPLCAPSRNSIITGLYPSQTKVYGNQVDPITHEMRDSTFMNKLQHAGYYTALIGKHHYIDRFATGTDMVRTDEAEVKRYGFNSVVQVADVFETMPNDDKTENIDNYIYYLRKKGLEKKYFDNLKDSLQAGRHPLASEDTQDGFIGLTACRFIETYDRNAPFYLNISFVGPHPPYEVPASFSRTNPESTSPPIGEDAQPNKATKKKRAVYDDMIAQIDHYVGELIASLKRTGRLDNTVFLFTADHGDNLGDFGIWDKRYFYEQSAGVPFFISGKGIPGRNPRLGIVESKALVSTLDIYPTILHLAGITDAGQRPGRNLLDILQDKNMREAVFSQLGTMVMIRTAGWKMVFDPQGGGAWYLFNLINDPHELKNLAGVAGYEGITADLTARLLSFYISLDQKVQMKEQLRLQKVRVGVDN